jgi:hypothetical protein
MRESYQHPAETGTASSRLRRIAKPISAMTRLPVLLSRGGACRSRPDAAAKGARLAGATIIGYDPGYESAPPIRRIRQASMTRYLRPLALALALSTGALGCKSEAMGNPSSTLGTRTYANMLPYITKSLTPALAEEQFGFPDAKQSTGTIVYIYNVEEQKKVSLGFPGPGQTISFATLTLPGGTQTPIPIAD